MYIVSTNVNCFHYLYQDAELLRSCANTLKGQDFKQVQFSRTAILLYVFSLEALINRAMAEFLPPHLREFYLEREKELDLREKWELLPLLLSNDPQKHFDKSSYPWSQFTEIVRIRNEFVHPKYARNAFYRMCKRKRFESVIHYVNQIPPTLGINAGDLVYPQTQIPKDPYIILPAHVDLVKRVVDDIITKLDELLDRRISANNWLHNDQMTLIWPEGSRLDQITDDDLPE